MVDLSGIQTRIVGVEGEHTNHLTTTTALANRSLALKWYQIRGAYCLTIPQDAH